MGLTTEQKSTQSYKINKGVADTNTDKKFFEEPTGGRIVPGSTIWAEDNLIPQTAPSGLGDGDISGVVQRKIDLVLVAVPGSPDSFYHADLVDAVPFNWGDGSYVYTVKNSLGNGLPAGYNSMEVDIAAGVLRFYDGVGSNMPPSISFFRYVGNKGVMDGIFPYEQDFTNETSIVVQHNLGKRPKTDIFNDSRELIVGSIVLDGVDPLNKLQVDFNIQVSGKIVCS